MPRRSIHRLLMGTAAPLAFALPAFAQAPQPAPAAAPQASQAIAEVVVTGSRIAQTGVNMPTPVTVISQNLIAQTGHTQLAQVLNELPQFRATTSSSTQFVGGGGNIAGANLLDLRGLGTTRTLVLVDGLRFPPTTTQESFNSDLIPSSLVSRLDVVTGGASAAYGSDAVAGVVNIILDHKLEGLRGSVQYGQTDARDGQDEKYSIAGGHAFLDGRFHVIAGADYEHRDATGTCYSRSWCAQEYGIVSNPTPGVNGVPALVIAPNVRASQNTAAGLVVSSRLVSAFGGQQVSADGKSLAPFTFGQLYAPNNNQMIGGAAPGINPFADAFRLRPAQSRWATYAHGEGDVTNHIQGFVDVSYGHLETVGNYAQYRGGNQNAAGTAPSGPVNTAALAISSSNPFVPAQLLSEMKSLNLTSVDIGKNGDGFPAPTSQYSDDTYRIAAGFKGEVFSGWKWDVSYMHGQSKLNLTGHNVINQPNFSQAVQAVQGTGANAGQIVCAVNQSSNVAPGCAPFNVFGNYTASPASLAYIFGTPTQKTTDTMDDVSANIQGVPFKTWAGPVSVATGIEYRAESLNADVDALSAASAFTNNSAALYGRSKVIEAYAETTVPVLADLPFAKELSFNAAFRRTQYNLDSPKAPVGTLTGAVSSEFNASTWKIGFVERPFDWLRFRGTMSKDFRAPNMNDLFTLPTVAGNSAILDPLTKTSTQVPTTNGGNPNLRPENAFTSTVGFTLQPGGVLRNLQISVDYYDIKVKDYIAAVGAQTLINECFGGIQSACPLVSRNSSNVLTGVLNVSANANQLEEVGTDLELDYRHSIGNFGNVDLRVLATIYSRLQYVNAGTPISGACQDGFVTQQPYPSMPCYTINSRVNWTNGPWLAGIQFRYIPAGKYGTGFLGPQDPGYSPLLANSVNNNRVDAITYVDINAAYKIYRKGGHEVEVFGAINNLFNPAPPPVPANNIGTNATLYDVVGRTFNVGVRFRY